MKNDSTPSEGWGEKFDKRFDRIMSIGHKINGRKVTYNCQTDCKDDVKNFLSQEIAKARQEARQECIEAIKGSICGRLLEEK